MSKISPTFCVSPWTHLTVMATGKIKSCCVGKTILGNTDTVPILAAWNSEEMKTLRLDMLSGRRNDNCSTCYTIEDAGGHSIRQGFNEDTSLTHDVMLTGADGNLAKFNLQFLDIRFSNLCNGKCRICNPDESSALAVERNERRKSISLPIPVIQTAPISKNSGIKVSDFYHSAKRIYFSGGEPFIMQQHWDVLRELVEYGRANDIILRYNTNGNTLTFMGENIFDYWKRFKEVHVFFSIDALGDAENYWRAGTKWDNVIANIIECNTRASDDVNLNVGVCSAIGWPNVFSWIKLIDYFVSTDIINLFSISVNPVLKPLEFSLSSATDSKKRDIETALTNLADRVYAPRLSSQILALIKIMNERDTTYALTNMKETFELDKFRGHDFFAAFPEHEDMREILNAGK